MDVEVLSVHRLRFGRRIAGSVGVGGGRIRGRLPWWCRTTPSHAAWLHEETVTLRAPSCAGRSGYELFDEASGTKHLKPDFEAACQVKVDGVPAAMVLGSGFVPGPDAVVPPSAPGISSPVAVVADMSHVYSAVGGSAFRSEADFLNLEGACTVGGCCGGITEGFPSAGLPSANVDVDLTTALAAALGQGGRWRTSR